jgi:hypothetical protein
VLYVYQVNLITAFAGVEEPIAGFGFLYTIFTYLFPKNWRRYRRRETPLPGCCCTSISGNGSCSRLSTALALPGLSFVAAKRAPINGWATSALTLASPAHTVTCDEPWKLLADLQMGAPSQLACMQKHLPASDSRWPMSIWSANIGLHIPRTPTTRWAGYAQPASQNKAIPGIAN